MDIRVNTEDYAKALKLHKIRCKGRQRARLEDQSTEEIGEYLSELMKRRRNRGSDEAVLLEIADMIICLYALVPHLTSPEGRAYNIADLNDALVIKTGKWRVSELSGKEPEMSSENSGTLLD